MNWLVAGSLSRETRQKINRKLKKKRKSLYMSSPKTVPEVINSSDHQVDYLVISEIQLAQT